MKGMRKIFESNTRTRINIIGPSNSEKSLLTMSLIKNGVFDTTEVKTKEHSNSFPTEILCCGPRENKVRILIDFKTKKEMVDELKGSILTLIDQSFFEVMHEPEMDIINDNTMKKNKFINKFIQKMINNLGTSLMRYLDKTDLCKVFANVNFEVLFDELNNETYTQKLQIRDDIIWNKFFKQFSKDLTEKYDEWNLIVEDYYIDKYDIEGCEYINEYSYDDEIFNNKFLNILLNMLYNNKHSCGLMINRVYIEAPSKENEYSNIVFIDYKNENLQSIFEKNIEERISKDYKEVFLIVLPCNHCCQYVYNIKDKVNKVTLDKRIYCILNNFNELKRFLPNNEKDVLSNLKSSISKELGIKKEKTIITENFNDIDKTSLNMLESNSEFIRLLKLIKIQTYSFSKTIKIKNPSRENLISISLNQERMSVQALMAMLFERYSNHLINEWRKMINSIIDYDNNKKYYYNVTRYLINDKKYDFYKINKIENKHIDFSLRNGEHNEAKKILKMLVNYGYHTIGFDPEKNKILIKVNGDISNEDKVILIESIKGRLEESIISSFENVFFNNLINKKINIFDLSKTLDNQIDITIDDFYCTFKQVFNTMSKNIQRYEVSIQ